MDKMTVMGVGAHPDDLELLCGGTLARYAALGHKVVMAHLNNGDKGHYKLSCAEIAEIRKQEAENAGKIIGAEVVSLDVPDAELFSNLETRRLVINLVRQVQPDMIITHSPADYLADHITTSELVWGASYFGASPLLKTQAKTLDKIVPVFFVDTLAGMGFLPTDYVDISETFEKKMEMIRQHDSQLQWLLEHDDMDILELVEISARFRGLQCGVQYAEGFRQYEVWGRKIPARLLP